MSFISAYRERWGIEPVCKTLQVAPSTYYAAISRRPSARQAIDEQLKVEIGRVHRDNFGVYGVDKVWAQLNRDDVRVARCTVARLMRELALRGVVRGKPKFTTVPADAADRPRDLVDRRFSAGAVRSRPSRWCTTVSTSSSLDAYAAIAITSSGSSAGSASALAIESALM